MLEEDAGEVRVRAGGPPRGLVQVSTWEGIALSQGGGSRGGNKWSASPMWELSMEGRGGGMGGSQREFLGLNLSNQVNIGAF